MNLEEIKQPHLRGGEQRGERRSVEELVLFEGVRHRSMGGGRECWGGG